MTRSGFMTVRAAGGAFPSSALADAAAPRNAAECRAITDFDLRGKCWDALDRESQTQTQTVKKKEFGLGLRPPSIAAILPNREETRARAQAERQEIRSLTLTLASVEDTPAGKMLLTSTDGAIWEQTDSDTINSRPAAGDTVQVTKGVLGGYMCQVTRWQAVRCQRDK
jgi:hypothetical protein